MQNINKIKNLINSEYAYLMAEHDNWSLVSGSKNMEIVAHALRVILHAGDVKHHEAEWLAVVDCQNEEGAWGGESDNPKSAPWASAFLALMLIRANAILKNKKITASIEKSIDFFIKDQKADGRWIDPAWADLDTTSHPVSFFNVVLAIGEPKWKKKVLKSWRAGLKFITDNQNPDGSWVDKDFHPTGVETTAHLVQDSVIASLCFPDRKEVAPNQDELKKVCAKGMEKLISFQAENGSYDNDNMDHTMDSMRSLVIISRVLREEKKCTPVIEKALDWILEYKCAQGWPDFPGMKVNLERTCDGLDVLLKYMVWREKDWKQAVRRWGYVTGIPSFKGLRRPKTKQLSRAKV
ncbi:MAG: terpene cyclase/mutase family protein [Candidatus Omnitrophica bacterium]|nr:terpene cyclase/mutase family protein [Candidatus Omnitrophota bacterium]